jgi:ankyrin repeat protein
VFDAAALGRTGRLREFVARDGSLVGAFSSDGFTPLHLAAFFGGPEAVATLLARGADPDADAENPFQVRPIHSAVAVGDRASAQALLEAGADPNVAQQGGFTPLDAAIHNQDAEMEALLRRFGAVSP